MIDLVTSGESHGKGMTVILRGIPSNLTVDLEFINQELARRQSGYGRGSRMEIETDKAEILSGVIGGRTTGAPVTMIIWNKDWENWKGKKTEPVLAARPGHADLTGAYKFGLTDDIRKVLERSSARETAARVAGGALVKLLLKEFGIEIFSHVVNWGGMVINTSGKSYEEIRALAERSELNSAADKETEEKIKKWLDQAKKEGDTVGGVIETVVRPVPPFLGSYQHHSEKLDSRIAAAVLSVQAVKGIEFGAGFGYAALTGKAAHDEIYFDKNKGVYYRETNRAGGLEGGMSNGNAIVFRSVMKPIPTLMSPLHTVNIQTKEPADAATERSDVSAVAACGVVIENAAAVEIANALIRRYGGDELDFMKISFTNDKSLKSFRWKS